MKKKFAILLMSTTMVVPLLVACTTPAENQTTSYEVSEESEIQVSASKKVVLRFTAMSDVHLNGSSSQTEHKRLEEAIDFMYSYASEQEYKNVDVLLVAGDMTDNGYENQLQTFSDVINNKLKNETQKLFVMGNHEYGNTLNNDEIHTLWETTLDTTRNTHIVVNGYHFIGVSPNNYSDYKYITTWLDEELKKASEEDPEKPIFVTQHYHIEDTVYGSDAWGTDELTEVLSKYPQVVNFSGHSHYPINDPRSIHQDKFTSLGCGTLSYFELEDDSLYGSIPPNANNAAQFYIVEVYSDNSIVLKPYDLITKQFFPIEYVVEKPSDPDSFVYTDARYETADNPVFEDEAKLNITRISDNGCTLSFKQATDGENLHSYRFDFYRTSDNAKKRSFKIWSEFYFLDMPEIISCTATGLQPGTEYRVTVTAIDSFGKESEKPIEAIFITTGEPSEPFDPDAPIPDADILDIVFDSNGAKDIGPLSKTVENFNTAIEPDEELDGAYVAKFTGNGNYLRIKFTGEDYSNYTDIISVAAKIKINEFPSSYSDAFANMQSGGYGFEINGSSKKIEFWISINGSYKVLKADITEGEYYSLVGTYDGSTVKLYVNGELQSTLEAYGKITYTATTTAYAFCVGSDISSTGKGEAFFDGNVAYAKVYSKVLTDEQVFSLGNK